MSAKKYPREGNVAARLFTAQAQAETKATAFIGPGNIWRIVVDNSHTAATFLQIFDKLSASVTVGTTVADYSLLIPAGQCKVINLDDMPIKNMTIGCVIAVTSTRTGAVAPGAAANVNIYYQN